MMFPRLTLFFSLVLSSTASYVNYELKVGCDEDYKPGQCPETPTASTMMTVEDFERCALQQMSRENRNFFWGVSGRGQTYKENFDAYKNINIIPRVLRPVSNTMMSTTVLGQRIAFPIGISPIPAQHLIERDGELLTAGAALRLGTVMILSSLSSVNFDTFMTDLSTIPSPRNLSAVVWIQTPFYENPEQTLRVVRSATFRRFRAIVVTVNSPVVNSLSCSNRASTEAIRTLEVSSTVTFQNITWLRRNTDLPIVVKGIMTGDDAVRAIRSGASAVMVSNSGGRQLDGAPSTIDVLPQVVRALRQRHPRAEVYVDGGVRNGYDVYKAIARGARAVFVGRPCIYGLTIGKEEGVTRVLNILKSEFNETMKLAGARRLQDIQPATIFPRQHPIG